MKIDNYAPSPVEWVRNQVDRILATGTTEGVLIMDRPVVLVSIRGRRSGVQRLVPVMRVEHDGTYAVVGSKGGAPTDPQWVRNLRAHPLVELQDGTTTTRRRARELQGDERSTWWDRCVAAFPPYAEYQTKTDRVIPVFVLDAA
ncbi:nitroreductase family deazaflavin-dependent oxidoreductase [Intrasporangium sp.]|uniref:nitroreductase family deazaflavin-dependent oxidoreductase n=1 Tax=Intrasporangium sp. TaxID=1925024 RepID=UPI0032220F23